jgi:hypothetical protein
MVEDNYKTEVAGGDQPISRKEALQKAGRYAAFTAAAMMLILEPVEGQRPPKKSPKPPRNGAAKSAQKPRTDPPPSY